MITQEQMIERLQFDLTRKTYSFSEYVTTSSPYVPPGKDEMWDLLLKHRAQNRAQAQLLARAIVDLGGVPQPGLFDDGAADTNYLSIVYLFELLARTLTEAIRITEERLCETKCFPALRPLLEHILHEEKRQHSEVIALLEKHRTTNAPTVAVEKSVEVEKAAANASNDKSTTSGGFDLQAFLAKKGSSRPAAHSATKEANVSNPAPNPDFDLSKWLKKKGEA